MKRVTFLAAALLAAPFLAGCYIGYYGSWHHGVSHVDLGLGAGVAVTSSTASYSTQTAAVAQPTSFDDGSYYIYDNRWYFIPGYVHIQGGSYYYYDGYWHVLPSGVQVIYGTPMFTYRPGYIGYWDNFRWIYLPSRYRFGHYYGGCWHVHPPTSYVYVTTRSRGRSGSGSTSWAQSRLMAPARRSMLEASRAPRSRPGAYRFTPTSVPAEADRRGRPSGWTHSRTRSSGNADRTARPRAGASARSAPPSQPVQRGRGRHLDDPPPVGPPSSVAPRGRDRERPRSPSPPTTTRTRPDNERPTSTPGCPGPRSPREPVSAPAPDPSRVATPAPPIIPPRRAPDADDRDEKERRRPPAPDHRTVRQPERTAPVTTIVPSRMDRARPAPPGHAGTRPRPSSSKVPPKERDEDENEDEEADDRSSRRSRRR